LSQDDLRGAIETTKLRVPIEDLVRERVPSLKRTGALWVACCPFHEERTPSFKVDPRRGTWHCFGACATGGDQISFLQRLDHLEFFEALEILAARAGVELPRRQRTSVDASDPLLFALGEAQEFFRRELAGREGRIARGYLEERGIAANTIDAFGLGYAPSRGQALVDFARSLVRAGRVPSIEPFQRAALVRSGDDGHHFDFFRGRLMIPIRDLAGRTVGFGARRLHDGTSDPKYINTPETPAFHKGRLIYGLERALADVRRGGHLILVEGYTDVIAAHQAGLAHVAAVLGTSTTEEHAALVRRSGARRVSLVFDGDAAGRQAAFRALAGLLPLSIELEVVGLPEGTDPFDLVVREGAEAFLAHLEMGRAWFDFAVEGLAGKRGAELARDVDRLLELFLRVPKAVHRESLVVELAERLGLSLESVREQWDQLPERRRARQRSAERRAEPRNPEPPAAPPDPQMVRIFEGLVGAVLVDSSLVPLVREHVGGGSAGDCADPHLARILRCVLEMYEDLDAEIDEQSVLVRLADDPARERVVGCVARARTAESAKHLVDGELARLRALRGDSTQVRLEQLSRELDRAEREGDEPRASSLRGELAQLLEKKSSSSAHTQAMRS